MSNDTRTHGRARQLVERAKHLQGAVEIRWIPEIREARERDLIDICAAADTHDAQVAALVAAAGYALDTLGEFVGGYYDVTGTMEQLRDALNAVREGGAG